MSTEDTACYVAKKPCGCVVGACVDDGEHPRDTAECVSRWIKDGLTVERLTVHYVRANRFGCECGEQQKELR